MHTLKPLCVICEQPIYGHDIYKLRGCNAKLRQLENLRELDRRRQEEIATLVSRLRDDTNEGNNR